MSLANRPFRRPLLLLLTGASLFLMAAFAAVYQMARSNRPHELTYAPWVAAATAIALVILIRCMMRTDAAMKAGASVVRGGILIVAAFVVGLFDLLLLLGSASSIPDVLAG